jgi:hypothetical protein
VLGVNDDGTIKINLGGVVEGEARNTATVELWQDPGTDAPPAPGDWVALAQGPGAGEYQITGHADLTDKGAKAGERRTYARDSDGSLVCSIWLRGDGSIEIASVLSGGAVATLRADGSMAVTGDLSVSGDLSSGGTITATGEITAKAGTPAEVSLSTHLHPTGMGPSGAPTPGS